MRLSSNGGLDGTTAHAARFLVAIAGFASMLATPVARAQENPGPLLQWFECRWTDMERRVPDWFEAGYGGVWLPPVSRGYMPPYLSNQNSTSAGYDVFDRFNLGKPGAETAYGTEAGFDRAREELQLANGLVYVDMVLNHNASRRTDVGFMNDGGYPGFWMAPPTPMRDKLPSDNWGDFHAGLGSNYLQSTNPNDPNYCLLAGDLVSLIDIDQGLSNMFIRQPVAAGNPANIPGGQYFNNPDANNARFYPDAALGTDTINNPGITTGAGELATSPFGAFPCNVPTRNEGSLQFNFGRFNTADPMAGDAIVENSNDYLIRWTQWMLDVHKVDGFRIDAIKHMPSWFYDNLFDAVVYNRRLTPDGRYVTPFSFGECVEGHDFCFDRYVRKPNGRASGRSGDWFGNRDVLDLSGAGYLRDVIRQQPWGNWYDILGAHIDSVDDGYNNGTLGVNHIWSHDNGSNGDGSAIPNLPADDWQGWYMHCYLVMRPGQAKLYHNARGIARTGSGFYPREGLPVALGLNPSNNELNPVITNLVQLSNWFGRGEMQPRLTDDYVFIFDRRTNTGGGVYSSNVLVACNRSYAGSGITSFDTRTVATNFPQGTRLVEYTGNAARSDVDPNNEIPEVVVVGAGGNVTIRVPRNQNVNGLTHNRGFVVFAPAVPSGTLSFSNVTSTLAADPATTFSNTNTANAKRRLTSLPVITGSSFDLTLTTTNGDVGSGNNTNADDNAVFRINQGYQDLNNNTIVDIDYTNSVVPGYEQFVTVHDPLYNKPNVNATGTYTQTIDASLLPEGVNYVSVVAFRKRNANEAPLFREFRKAIYIDRVPPSTTIVDPGILPDGTAQLLVKAIPDRTVNRVHLILNPPNVSNPVSLANIFTNQATKIDRLEWRRTVSGLHTGENTLLVISFEESGNSNAQFYTITVGEPPCIGDFDNNGGVDGGDLAAFFNAFEAGDSSADVDGNGGVDGGDLAFFFEHFEAGC